MYVLTADQRSSRAALDAVPTLLAAITAMKLSPHAIIAPFERTVGDEIQGVLSDAGALLDIVKLLARLGDWHVGIGIGGGHFPQHPPRSSEGSGPAFYAAREAVTAAKRHTPSLCVRGENSRIAAHLEALLRTKAHIITARSLRQWEIIDAVVSTNTRQDAARILGVSAAAVSQSLAASSWQLEQATDPLVLDLLDEREWEC